jgi:hypothetical protein
MPHRRAVDSGNLQITFLNTQHFINKIAALPEIQKRASSGLRFLFRLRFSSLDEMCAYYRTVEGRGGWPDYYAGVLAGLRGDREYAEKRLSLVIAAPASQPATKSCGVP